MTNGGQMTETNDWAEGLEGPKKKPMKRSTKIALWLFAALVAWLTLSNASFLAPDPVGKPKLIAHRGVLEENVNFLSKPCSLNELARTIRGILDPPAC